jgi:hypothetical protein
MPEDTQVFKVALRGEGILTSPRFNKGTAFNSRERKAFDLTGRLPFQVDTLDQQCDRAWAQVSSFEHIPGERLDDVHLSFINTIHPSGRTLSCKASKPKIGFFTMLFYLVI